MDKKSVLIIEDDFYITRAYSIKLEKEGINVLSVSDGEAAIDFLKKNNSPDLVVLDLMLPKKSGFEVLSEIRANNKWKNVPVIVLSNIGAQEDVQKIKELGVIEYLVKADIGIDEVIEKIKKYLQ
ncbi:MAG: response regulator [Patescibacteria group bacterium]